MIFQDRKAAGQKLAEVLAKYKNFDAVVYALPRGGVVVGGEIAQKLGIPLDLVIARKIGHPNDPEYAIAAVTEDGTLVENKAEVLAIDPGWFRKEVEMQKKEAQRRRRVYGGSTAQILAAEKYAIVVDDGIATGLTLKAALMELKKQNPKKLIVAVPVTPADVALELQLFADEVIALEVAPFFRGGVGAYYNNFPQITDEEVIAIIKQQK